MKTKEKKVVKKVVRKARHTPFPIGKKMFFRTVTYHLAGEVKSVGDKEIILKGGTVIWVADSGRFTGAIGTSNFSETEVYGKNDVVIGRGAIVDASVISKIEVKQK
ncbi:MAG: hypothetical protein KA886_04400 [Candidatus Cloacimonetes bacterium]|nr:hypothetical protein [Candidatus Cloacimonadota bacterium]